jgi:hypothetical protein
VEVWIVCVVVALRLRLRSCGCVVVSFVVEGAVGSDACGAAMWRGGGDADVDAIVKVAL